MGNEKRVAPAARPPTSIRVPIKNSEAEHSFVLSLIYFKDQGPVCNWTDDGESLFSVMKYLGERQRDRTATTGDKHSHYQTNKNKLIKEAHGWLKENPAVAPR
jgi:hypothetical protein